MADQSDNFVPHFDDEENSAALPTEESHAPETSEARASAPPAVFPQTDATKEHEPTAPLPPSEAAPPRIEYQITPPAPARRAARPVPALLIVLVFVFLCLVSAILVIVSGALGTSLPPQVAGLAGFLTPALGQTATPSLTVTVTPTRVPTLGATPTLASFVTILPSLTAVPPSPTPSQTPVSTPTPIPPTSPPVPTPIPTLSAPTLTPAGAQSAPEITQAGIPMINVPSGTFNMGSDAFPSEKPIHPVMLASFYLDKYEVTNASWAACVVAGACSQPGSTDGYDGKPYYGAEAFNNYPVIFVSWFNADAYCHWRGGRLPSEAEWEMAARWNPSNNAVTVYPWGNDWNPANLNYCDSSCLNTDPRFKDASFNDNWPQMAPQGTFAADRSPLGLFDMGGNVAEWVADWYAESYYAVSPAQNPVGPATGIDKVIRGGGWSLNQFWSRSAARNHFGPLTQAAGVGFRCALNP